MKTHNALTDDLGVKWEFLYDQNSHYVENDEPGARERLKYTGTTVHDFRYRMVGADTGWFALPSWADVAEDWKITLSLFDEDEETGELTYWPVAP